jgi:bifunctional non-homologous end joining protein LigD
MHARLDRGKAQLLTRTGLDWTHKWPVIAAALSPCRQTRLTSMASSVASPQMGRLSFSLIQTASDSGIPNTLILFLFELPYLGLRAPNSFSRAGARADYLAIRKGAFHT